MRCRFDGSLYLVTDQRLMLGRQPESVVMAAVAGGVTAVQLREKEATTREFVHLARRLKGLLTPLAIPLIINDRVDVALAADADGVHVGQQDMLIGDVRRLLGAKRIIGLSIESCEQLADSSVLEADYLGVSPIFATPTKVDTRSTWGLQGLRQLRSMTAKYLVAIGGVNADNAAQILRAGADGIAVVSAICAAAEIEKAAQHLRKIVAAARHI